MSEERIKERCKREDIVLKIVEGFLEKHCDKDTELYYSLETLLDFYQKEKEKNKAYTELLKQNENRAKIKTCMTHNLPDNAEIICMIREDFDRNFGNDYISKDKIREKIEFYKRYGKIKNSDEYVMSVEIEVLEELLGE